MPLRPFGGGRRMHRPNNLDGRVRILSLVCGDLEVFDFAGQARVGLGGAEEALRRNGDILKTGFFDRGHIFLAAGCGRKPYAPEGVLQEVRGDRTPDDQIGDAHSAAGPEDPANFAECRELIRAVVDDAIADDDIDGIVGDGQSLDGALFELKVGVVAAAGIIRGFLDHFGRGVHAEDLSGFADRPSGKKGIQTSTAADIQDRLARLQASNGRRVAASQAHNGPGRHEGELGVGVSDGPGLFDGIEATALPLGGWSGAFGQVAILIAHAYAMIVALRHVWTPLPSDCLIGY
jgi:hypothetical protein